MKKGYGIPLVVLFALTLMVGAASAPCMAAGKNGPAPVINKDGSAFVKENRVTQADRQKAADRAKAKGFVVPKTTDSEAAPTGKEETDQNSPNNGGSAQ